MKRTFLLLALAVISVVVSAQTERKLTVMNSADGNSEITVYLPAESRHDGMAVLCCPGGGYQHLAIDHEGHQWAGYFNAQGIAYAVLKYRMPNGDREIPLGDAYNAMRTLRDSAEVWHINPRAVGIMGFSAGGHLASAVSTHAPFDARPDFSILFYPVISMDKRITHRGSCDNFLGASVEDPAMIKQWSSDKAVRSHLTPPAVIFTANDDRVVHPATNAISYYTSMCNAGNDCSLFVYPSGGHGFGFRTGYKYHNQMIYDLTTWLNTLTLPSSSSIKVACVGNSITDGHGIEMRTRNGYPALLQKKLGKGYEVRNFGVSARTMMNRGDHPYQKELAWRDCLAFQPDVVIIKLGTNDSKQMHQPFIDTDFANDAQQIIDQLKALPSKPRIIVCTPVPAIKDSWTINDDVITSQIIPILNKVAKRNKLEVLDLHTLFGTDPSLLQDDGIHPNDKGVAKMAELVYSAITDK